MQLHVCLLGFFSILFHGHTIYWKDFVVVPGKLSMMEFSNCFLLVWEIFYYFYELFVIWQRLYFHHEVDRYQWFGSFLSFIVIYIVSALTPLVAEPEVFSLSICLFILVLDILLTLLCEWKVCCYIFMSTLFKKIMYWCKAKNVLFFIAVVFEVLFVGFQINLISFRYCYYLRIKNPGCNIWFNYFFYY